MQPDLMKRSDSYAFDDTATLQMITTRNGVPYSSVDKTTSYSSENKWFIGYGIKDFHKRMKRGELLPMTPWDKYTYSGRYSGALDYTYTKLGYTYHRYMSSLNYPHSSSFFLQSTILESILPNYTPELTARFVQDAAAKIYSSGFDALTFVAELADTKEMFLALGKKLLKVRIPKTSWVKAFKKSFKKLKLKDLPNSWLEGRYGWRTLVYDIFNINEVIQNYNDRRSRYSERAGRTDEYSWTEVLPLSDDYFNYEQYRQFKVKVQQRGSVVADIEVPKIQANVLATAWELIPLSFVVDWFLSVGKAISTISFLALTSKYTAAYGYRIDLSLLVDRINLGFANKNGVVMQSGNEWYHFKIDVSKEVRTPYSVPLTPHLTLNLNNMKILDLMSLVVQRIKFRR